MKVLSLFTRTDRKADQTNRWTRTDGGQTQTRTFPLFFGSMLRLISALCLQWTLLWSSCWCFPCRSLPSWQRALTWSISRRLLKGLPFTETQKQREKNWTGRTGPNSARTRRSSMERTWPVQTLTSCSPKSSECWTWSWMDLPGMTGARLRKHVVLKYMKEITDFNWTLKMLV